MESVVINGLSVYLMKSVRTLTFATALKSALKGSVLMGFSLSANSTAILIKDA